MDISRKQVYVYVAIAVLVAAVGARYLLTARAGAAGAPGFVVPVATPAASPPASPSPTASPSPLVAYVCGAVERPGVYRLEQGSRVADLIAKAGGASPKAQLEAVNLAALLADGQQVVVPERGTPAAAAASVAAPAGAATGPAAAGAAPGAPVNLNTATAEQLDALPGVGPSTAQKIIDYRTTSGGFKSVDDLKNVSGIGDVRFAALKDLVTV